MLGNANGIDLNNSPLSDLSRVGGLGRVLALRLIERRPIRRWRDVECIEGFDAELVNDLRGSGAILGRPNPALVTIQVLRSRTLRQEKSSSLAETAMPAGPKRLARNIFSGIGQDRD